MLQPFYYFVLEGFAFVVCFLIYLNLRIKKSPMIDEKVFLYMIFANMLIICADIITWYVDGKKFPLARFMLISSNVLYYLLSSTILFLWLLYVSLRTKKNSSKHKLSFVILILLPILFETIMSITAPFNGLYFYVDTSNVYHRGSWCWTQAFIGIVYLIYAATIALIHCVREKHSHRKKEFLMLVIFTIFPLICSVVQSQYFGLPLIWIGTTISFLIFFIQTQNSQISIDALTQLNNRGKFESYILQKIHDLKNSETLFLVVIDIDNFKKVNDIYGHTEGDRALTDLAYILNIACMVKKDFAARYGGDEFALICIRPKTDSALPLMERVLNLLADYNKQKDKPYSINISFGIAAYTNDSNKTEDALKKEADEYMYEMKAIHHKDAAKNNCSISICQG